MASDDCVAAFSAQAEAPLAPFYGSDLVVMGKRILMSQFSSNFDRHMIEEALQQLFPAHAQLVLMPSSDGSPLSLERMSYDQILEAAEMKLMVLSALIKELSWKTLKLSMILLQIHKRKMAALILSEI